MINVFVLQLRNTYVSTSQISTVSVGCLYYLLTPVHTGDYSPRFRRLALAYSGRIRRL